MSGGTQVLCSWMMDGHKEGGLEYLAAVRRAADFNNFDVKRFRYRRDQLLFGGYSDYCSSYLCLR